MMIVDILGWAFFGVLALVACIAVAAAVVGGLLLLYSFVHTPTVRRHRKVRTPTEQWTEDRL